MRQRAEFTTRAPKPAITLTDATPHASGYPTTRGERLWVCNRLIGLTLKQLACTPWLFEPAVWYFRWPLAPWNGESALNLRTFWGGTSAVAQDDLAGLLGDGADRAEEMEAAIAAGLRGKAVFGTNLGAIATRIVCDEARPAVRDQAEDEISAARTLVTASARRGRGRVRELIDFLPVRAWRAPACATACDWTSGRRERGCVLATDPPWSPRPAPHTRQAAGAWHAWGALEGCQWSGRRTGPKVVEAVPGPDRPLAVDRGGRHAALRVLLRSDRDLDELDRCHSLAPLPNQRMDPVNVFDKFG